MVDTIHNVTAVQGLTAGRAPAAQPSRVSRPVQGTTAPTKASVSGGTVGDISGVVSALNGLVQQVSATKITFDIDETTGESVILVLNKETGELIRQVPPKELLDLAAKMKQLSGLIFSQEA